jgi:hypothetical protein
MATYSPAFEVLTFLSERRESVRLMRKGEVIPSGLEAGFDLLGKLDPDWIWVLDVGGVVKGVLVASPAHGAAMIWRISVEPGQSTMAVGKLLRAFLRDIRGRGIAGYLTALSLTREPEKRLAAIIEQSGGRRTQDGLSLYASPLPKEGI